MTSWKRRLLIVEDDNLVASLLCETLTGKGFETESCESVSKAVTLLEKFDPDAVLLDVHLGNGPSGIQLGHRIHLTNPEVAIVFLSKYPEASYSSDSKLELPPGSAFVSKDLLTDSNQLARAIEEVLNNNSSSSPQRDDLLLRGELKQLTSTQLEILRLASLGLTNSAIASRRGTNERTVEQRLKAIYQALNISVTSDANPRVLAIRAYITQAGMPSEASVSRS
jgi:DNA-binding NarL/FixJ family response regulator